MTTCFFPMASFILSFIYHYHLIYLFIYIIDHNTCVYLFYLFAKFICALMCYNIGLAPFSRLVAFNSRLQFLRFCESNTILVSKIRHSDLLQTRHKKCGSNFVISDTTIGYYAVSSSALSSSELCWHFVTIDDHVSCVGQSWRST